jgi:hypothetical protein
MLSTTLARLTVLSLSFFVALPLLDAEPSPAVGGAVGSAVHWAFRPIHAPPPPPVSDAAKVSSPIDAFVIARLEAAGIAPSPEASRRVLARRAYYDLLGLPPSVEELVEFESDARPDAWERLVDRLLASPAYGERWARHWLDVARYADTKDLVLLYGQDAIRPFSYTYRDYVIRAINDDTPFDRFVLEQLAADRLDLGSETWRLGALGFLTLGRLFDNNPHDIYDDQIDTVSRGFLGLTVACARCHDHKYDPIGIDDYYALYGVFANSTRPLGDPLIEVPEGAAAIAFEAQYASARQALIDHIDREYASESRNARERFEDYLVHVATRPPDPLENSVFFMSLSPDQLRPQIIARWRKLLDERARPEDPVFGAWAELLAIDSAQFAARAPAVVAAVLERPLGIEPGTIHPALSAALASAQLREPADVARLWARVIHGAASGEESVSTGAGAIFAASARRELAGLVDGPLSPLWFPKSETYLYMSRVPRDRFHSLWLELDKIAVREPAASDRAMVLEDVEELSEPRIFARGNPTRPGAVVPRRYLRFLSTEGERPLSVGSGRLDLARAIVDPSGPLTARVIAQRIWMHHFGEPLVATPDDFGHRSEAPIHVELLDWLAARLIASGWSMKALHREILLSWTWRQSSEDRADARESDPENRLLWRRSRRRLEFEAFRDTLLAVSGRLDRTFYGRPVDIAADSDARRRTIYGLVDRQNLPELFRAFDFACPDQSVGRRPRTVAPQAALFAMNSEFVAVQIRAIAARQELRAIEDPRERVRKLYRIVFARDPDVEEEAISIAFVTSGAATGSAAGDTQESSELGPWERLAQVLLWTSELSWVD